MTALSFVWVHPYSQNSGCDNNIKHSNTHCIHITSMVTAPVHIYCSTSVVYIKSLSLHILQSYIYKGLANERAPNGRGQIQLNGSYQKGTDLIPETQLFCVCKNMFCNLL